MSSKSLSFLISAASLCQASASLIIDDFGTKTIDFSDFRGAGFTPTPGADQLDSDTWRATGFSDGDGSFGGTHTSGDFARGTDAQSPHNGVNTGGAYGFQVASGDYALGVQPGGSDFTPGTFTLRLENNTGQAIRGFDVEYDVFVFNDQDRSNFFNFSWSSDDVSYTDVPGLDFTSEAGRTTGGASWSSTARSTILSGLTVADGDFFYLQWSGDDVGGSGSRDEFALDNISITAAPIPEPSTTLPLAILLGMTIVRVRRR